MLALILAFLLTLIYLARTRKLIAYLEQNHRDVWIGLGSPRAFANSSPQNYLNLLKFIAANNALGDAELALLLTSVRWLLTVAFVFYILAIISFIALFLSASVTK